MKNILTQLQSDFLLGVCHPGPELDMKLAAGIAWVRADVPFPFAVEDGGTLTERYVSFRKRAESWHAAGLRLMGLTPYPRDWPFEAGEPGSARFLEVYRRACAFMAADLAFVAPLWQVSNELNLAWFRRPFPSEEAAIPFLLAGGAGIRDGQPNAILGVNMATGHEESADRMYRWVYAPDSPIDWDYVGMDAYYGTWEPGGPSTWPDKLRRLHEMVQKPVIVAEFGYPSEGGCMTAEERGDQESFSQLLHKTSAWPYAWAEGHTPEAQARYLVETLQILRDTPFVLGAFWYKWADGAPCNCGNPDCPENRAYGLITIDGEPKPAYRALENEMAPQLQNSCFTKAKFRTRDDLTASAVGMP